MFKSLFLKHDITKKLDYYIKKHIVPCISVQTQIYSRFNHGGFEFGRVF